MVQTLESADPRLKILLALVLGILTWSCGPVGLLLFLTLAGLLSWRLLGRGELLLPSLRSLVGLVLIWCLLKAGFAWWEGGGWLRIGQETALLGGRLLTLILLGLCLTALTSFRQLGRALVSFLRPFPGQIGWQAALGMAMMIHFLPMCLRTFRQVRLSLRLRGEGLPVWTRLRCFVQTVLRVLAGRTWEQTMALASRDLDRPGAWQEPLPFRPFEWLSGLAAALAAGLIALL